MSQVIIGAPRLSVERGWSTLSAAIQVADWRGELYFRVSQGPLATSANPFVLSMLPPAMKLGLPVRVEAPLSPQFQALQAQMQGFIPAVHPTLHTVPVEAASEHTPQPPPGRRGVFVFFSGGVDSFYSLLMHRDEITHVVFVHGFDTLLAHKAVRARNVQAVRQAAAELSKGFIEVETNYRSCVDRFEKWEHHTATIAQLAIASVLGSQFHRAYLAENFDYFRQSETTNTATVWRADGIETLQDGIDCKRIDKTAYIADSATAMRWLRVCWQNKAMAYNCGRCEKCLRTMIALRLAGALHRCRTFDRPIDLERIRYLRFSDSAYFWPELLAALERRPADAALAEAARDSIGWATVPDWTWVRLLPALESHGSEPELARIARERMEFARQPADPRRQAEQIFKAMTRVFDLQDELATIKSSRSWKLTALLRRLGTRLRRERQQRHIGL